MHFEFLVEDQSGKRMLDHLVPKIIADGDTFRAHPYKGIGKIPKGLKPNSEPEKRILLDQLPRLLRGYGLVHAGYERGYMATVIVVCDLDSRNSAQFLAELHSIITAITPAPETRFCLAIEEGEAWFLGDRRALLTAYPNAKAAVLDGYVQDSICGTWEVLADAVHQGGAAALEAGGFWVVGTEKSRWAEMITPHMDPAVNQSPSFGAFRNEVGKLTGT